MNRLCLLVAGILFVGCEGGGEPESPAFDGVAMDTLVRLDFREAPTLPSDRGIVARSEATGEYESIRSVSFDAEGRLWVI